nr:hypothetical protein BaRGS_018543 [Batillaria attramentaria]
MVGIEILYLSQNSLLEIPDGAFDHFTNLSILKLQNNRLSRIEEGTFSESTRSRLTSLDISENPFQCSCDIMWFRNWLRTQPGLFPEAKNGYRCSNLGGVSITSYDLNEQACLLNHEVYVFMTVSLTLLLLFLSLLVLVYRYRWNLRLLLYETSAGRTDRRRHYLMGDHFVYDLFVSYAAEDQDWVTEILVPELEGRMDQAVCVNGNCDVNIETRRFCPHCRLQRCLNSGMKSDMILGSDERKARLEKMAENRRKRQQGVTQGGRQTPAFTSHLVTSATSGSVRSSRYPQDIVNFVKRFKDFRLLSVEDQVAVMKGAHAHRVYVLASFSSSLKQILRSDPTALALLQCITLFDPRDANISDRQLVNSLADKYNLLLKHHMESQFSYLYAAHYLDAVRQKLEEMQGVTDVVQAMFVDWVDLLEPLMREVLNLG